MPKSKRKNGEKLSVHDERRSVLIGELRSLIDELDEEGLAFLLSQAQVLTHNAAVDERNRELEREVRESPDGNRDVGITMTPPSLRIERSDDGKTYHVVMNGKYKMFDVSEMVALVRLSHGHEREGDACRALYAWFKRERGDALSDFGIADAAAGVLIDLVQLIRRSFRKPGSP